MSFTNSSFLYFTKSERVKMKRAKSHLCGIKCKVHKGG